MNTLKNTLYWSIITEKKHILQVFMGLFFAYLLAYGLFSGFLANLIAFPFTGKFDAIDTNMHYFATTICFVVLAIVFEVLTAHLFSNLWTKQGRAQFFMLPATNAQKFWSRVILAVTTATVVSLLALAAVDLLQIVLTQIFTGECHSIFAVPLKMTDAFPRLTTPMWILGGIAFIAAIASDAAMYVLGGTYFQKIPWIMTQVCKTVIQTLASILLGLVSVAIGDTFVNIIESWEIEFLIDPILILEIFVIVCTSLFATLFLWLAYRKFKRLNIVSGKLLS